MRVVELFAGIGGFRLGLIRNKMEVVYANEWDKYAAEIYDKNFSGAIDRRSITDVPATEIPPHDVIAAGFPCQAFSIAGKRRGFDETRGTLFFEIMRIARHHRTPYLLLENVKGLLSHDRGRTFETILGTLDESGYDCQWQVFNSKDFGVPQNRERVFIIGHSRTQPRPQVFPLEGAVGQVPEAGEPAGSGAQAFIKTRHLSQNGSLMSDAITLQASEVPHITNALTSRGGGFRGSRERRTMVIDGKPSATRRGFIKDDYTGALDEDSNQLVADSRVRRLTPVECERLQGFPDNWTVGVSDTQRYKTLGNAVTVNVVEAIGKQLALI